MEDEKIAHTVAAPTASDGPLCQRKEGESAYPVCRHPANYHAATEVNGPRDGVCRVKGCPCSGFTA